MAEVKNFLIAVNSGANKTYNHYAAYVVAFMAKQIAKRESIVEVKAQGTVILYQRQSFWGEIVDLIIQTLKLRRLKVHIPIPWTLMRLSGLNVRLAGMMLPLSLLR